LAHVSVRRPTGRPTHQSWSSRRSTQSEWTVPADPVDSRVKLCTVCGVVTSRAGSRCIQHARQSNRSRHNALCSTRALQRASALGCSEPGVVSTATGALATDALPVEPSTTLSRSPLAVRHSTSPTPRCSAARSTRPNVAAVAMVRAIAMAMLEPPRRRGPGKSGASDEGSPTASPGDAVARAGRRTRAGQQGCRRSRRWSRAKRRSPRD
jgi:hypothetical protein